MRESSNTSPLLCFVTAKAKPIKAKRSKEETITIIFLFVFILISTKQSVKLLPTPIIYLTIKIIPSRSKESTNHRNLPLTTIAYIIRAIKSTNILEIYIYFILY